MKLAEIPQLLKLLLDRGRISAVQKEEVQKALQEGDKDPAGTIAVKKGFLAHAVMEQTLLDQVLLKAEAALKDILVVGKEGKQTVPGWLKANWGNNGVNASETGNSTVPGISAAANIAQNLVMLANEAAEEGKPFTQFTQFQEGIVAAVNLARGIHAGDSREVPIAKKATEWMLAVKKSLEAVLEGQDPRSTWSKEAIKLEEFLNTRFQEIHAAITLSLIRQQNKPVSIGFRP